MRKTLAIATLVTFGIYLLIVSMFAPANADYPVHHEKTVPTWATRECKTAYQVNCHWTAWRHGDPQGHDFIVREVPGSTHMVCVFYVETRYAKHHDYCS